MMDHIKVLQLLEFQNSDKLHLSPYNLGSINFWVSKIFYFWRFFYFSMTFGHYFLNPLCSPFL